MNKSGTEDYRTYLQNEFCRANGYPVFDYKKHELEYAEWTQELKRRTRKYAEFLKEEDLVIKTERTLEYGKGSFDSIYQTLNDQGYKIFAASPYLYPSPKEQKAKRIITGDITLENGYPTIISRNSKTRIENLHVSTIITQLPMYKGINLIQNLSQEYYIIMGYHSNIDDKNAEFNKNILNRYQNILPNTTRIRCTDNECVFDTITTIRIR